MQKLAVRISGRQQMKHAASIKMSLMSVTGVDSRCVMEPNLLNQRHPAPPARACLRTNHVKEWTASDSRAFLLNATWFFSCMLTLNQKRGVKQKSVENCMAWSGVGSFTPYRVFALHLEMLSSCKKNNRPGGNFTSIWMKTLGFFSFSRIDCFLVNYIEIGNCLTFWPCLNFPKMW